MESALPHAVHFQFALSHVDARLSALFFFSCARPPRFRKCQSSRSHYTAHLSSHLTARLTVLRLATDMLYYSGIIDGFNLTVTAIVAIGSQLLFGLATFALRKEYLYVRQQRNFCAD